MNEKKAKALELLLRGDTVVSIANELGVGRRTIYNWLQSDVEFRKAKQQNENIILDNTSLPFFTTEAEVSSQLLSIAKQIISFIIYHRLYINILQLFFLLIV